MKNLTVIIRNLPLKQKLLYSFMVASITSLALACLIFILNDYLTGRTLLLNEGNALADTLGSTSTAALAFEDKKTAHEILQALKAHPHIDMAALYQKDGTDIAVYVREGTTGRPSHVDSIKNRFFDQKNIHISRPVSLDSEYIGRIYLRYDLSGLASRQMRFIYLVLFVLVLVSCFTYLIASFLMKFISKPLKNLVDVAHAVSLNRDYSIRAECFSPDEIGVLADSVNDMLVQIQARDIQLVQQQEQLEVQVANRTHELKTANEHLTVEIAERKLAELALDESNRRLEALSITDALTGIANRRRFDAVLLQEHARHARSGGELSLVMLDIDHFKEFNDCYGHVNGDECLRQIGQVIASSVTRIADLAARYGGEEFICILPETDSEGAVAIAEYIRRDILALVIPHKGSKVAGYVTASFGVITVKCSADGSAAYVVAQVDELLYRAKFHGRNRVVSIDSSKAVDTAVETSG